MGAPQKLWFIMGKNHITWKLSFNYGFCDIICIYIFKEIMLISYVFFEIIHFLMEKMLILGAKSWFTMEIMMI